MHIIPAISIAAGAAFTLGAAAPSGQVELRIDHLRNTRGMIQICLTASVATFPDCAKDKQAITRTIPANAAGSLRFEGMKPGTYALAIFHDENGNKKLDTFLGIPREGFGFSRNPVIRFGPPSFGQTGFEVADGIARVTVRMQYLL
jgi:uncharacterized protein (DUF2141 family)